MNTQNRVQTLRSKGERLAWTPLKNVRRVKLTPAQLVGKKLSETELKNRIPAGTKVNLLIP